MRGCTVLFLLVATLASCDSTIETPPSQRGRYTLWGALDPTTDFQSVRVVAVTDVLLSTSTAPLPVTFTSTNLATGEETAWRDSLVTFRNGTVGHIYRARFRPTYGGRYRIVLRRDADGGEITAETTVPPLVVPTLLPTDLSRGVRVPIQWAGAPQLSPLRVTYFVRKYNILVALGQESGPLCVLDTASFGLPADPGRSGSGWIATIDYFDADRVLRGRLAEKPPVITDMGPVVRFFIDVRRVKIAAEVLSEDWQPPGGAFDFETLAAPEVFGNVEGGYGFVGAGFRSGFTFRPAREDLRRVGFFDTSGPVCPPGLDNAFE